MFRLLFRPSGFRKPLLLSSILAVSTSFAVNSSAQTGAQINAIANQYFQPLVQSVIAANRGVVSQNLNTNLPMLNTSVGNGFLATPSVQVVAPNNNFSVSNTGPLWSNIAPVTTAPATNVTVSTNPFNPQQFAHQDIVPNLPAIVNQQIPTVQNWPVQQALPQQTVTPLEFPNVYSPYLNTQAPSYNQRDFARRQHHFVAVRGAVANPEMQIFTDPGIGSWRSNLDNGYGVGIAAGGEGPLANSRLRLRTEGELMYRAFEVDTIDHSAFTGNATGSLTTVSAMGNAYLEIETGAPIRPYAGVGIGSSYVDYDGFSIGANNLVDDNENFALTTQIMAGVSIDVMPTASLNIEYRLTTVDDVELTSSNNGRLRDDLDFQSVTAGLQIRF